MKEKIKILIATHKDYEFPHDNAYLPIQVGTALSQNKLSIQRDDIGDNISYKNTTFCELTALYWAWKNKQLDSVEYVGLVHYRRYFSGESLSIKSKKIASSEEILGAIAGFDAILPKKRNYYIETVYEHYKNAHYQKDIDITRDVISKYYPDYLSSFDDVMKGTKLHLFNMFILRKEFALSYFDWLFGVLFRVESMLDVTYYDTYQKRVFGFIAERLFNVWLAKNKLKVKELPVINLEPDNYILKMANFLLRKFIGRSNK